MAKHDIKYKPEYAEKLPSMFANGEDVAEVATALGVSRQTFYNWLEAHEEFKEAYEIGKQKSEAWWAKLGRAGAAGKMDIQPTVWIFNMKNKFGWKDKQEHDHLSSDATMTPKETVIINVNMDPSEATQMYQDMINGKA